MTKRLHAAWLELCEYVQIPAEDIESRRNAQRFFYAGALAMKNILFEQTSEGEEVTTQDEQLMEDLHDELDEYAAGVIADPEKFML
jgi:hypothetical protein